VTGRISKAGDAMVRTALYEAANAILERGTRHCGSAPWRWHPVRRCQGGRGGITKGGINRFGRPVRVVRSRVPSPGRWIRSGRITCSGAAWLTARLLDWPADPYQTPSGGGHRADRGQKRDTGGRMGPETYGTRREDV
jgi:hypothetical protein